MRPGGAFYPNLLPRSCRPTRWFDQKRKRSGKHPLGVIRISVVFTSPLAGDPDDFFEPTEAETANLRYLTSRDGALRNIVLELEDSLPAGVEVGSIDLYEGSIELIVILVAAYKAIQTFDEVATTLAPATETLRGILRRVLAAPGGRVLVRGQYAPELVVGGAGGGQVARTADAHQRRRRR
jgi:hypothetical protein